MQNFLNKAGKSAIKMTNLAGSKATELVEVGKLKSKLNDVNQAKTLAKKDIGDYCYHLYQDGKITDENIIELCKKIDAAIEHAAEIEMQIQQAKDEYNAKTEIADPSLND